MLTSVTDRLRKAGIESSALDARLLIEQAVGLSREEILTEPERILTEPEIIRVESLVLRRIAREPMAQILGHKEFYGREFLVTRDVLIPRPDSETLIEAVLKRIGNRESGIAVLDLGTGSGCLLLTLLAELPQAVGTGVDISEAALTVARRNAQKLRLAARAEFIKSAWCEGLGTRKYQIILANPPYIASNGIRTLMPEVAEYEPHGALDGGEDGLDCYRQIAAQLPSHASRDAIIVLEIEAGQEDSVSAIFTQAGFTVKAIEKDLAGIARCVLVTMN